MKSLMLLVSVLFLLSGCATANKGANMSNVEDRVSLLEVKVASLEQKQGGFEGGASESVSYLEPTESLEKTSVNIEWTKENIQLALKNSGYYNGPIDGKIGKESKKAIMDFQKANGLKIDGIAGSETKDRLATYLK